MILARVMAALPAAGGSHALTAAEELQLQEVLGLDADTVRLLLEVSAYIFERSAQLALKAPQLLATLVDTGLSEAHVRARCRGAASARSSRLSERENLSRSPARSAVPCSSRPAEGRGGAPPPPAAPCIRNLLPHRPPRPAPAQSTSFAAVWASDSAAMLARARAKPLGVPYVLDSATWKINLGMGSDASTAVKTTTAAFDFSLSAARPSGEPGAVAAASFAVEFSRDELLGLFEKLDRVQQQMDALAS